MTAAVQSFREACRVEAREAGRYACEVPDGWQQGRGAFGGIAIGLGVRAMLEEVEPDRPLRALTAEIPGALMVGSASIRTRVLRRGRGLSALEAAIEQGDEVKVRATGLFGVARADDVALQPVPPERPAWEAVDPLPAAGLPPAFAKHMEFRVTGHPPFMSADVPRAEGWIRFREPLDAWGPAEVVALADAWWPSLFATMGAPRPMGTVSFALQLTTAADDLDPTRPLFHRARSDVASGGYVSERRELWTPGGALVAINTQVFAIIA